MSLLDTYEIREKAGAGGAGSVYKAYHKRLEKTVVIKKLHENINGNTLQRAEVDILKNLHHPYLPQVFDFFVEDGVAYTVMDYINGETFQQKLENGDIFSEKQVLKYAGQLCEALDYLHSQKIPVIHGDIKPDNIMLTPEDNICLIDFNISGISEGNHAVTFGCTEGYGAPEQQEAFRKALAKYKRTETKEFQNEKTELLGTDDRTEILPQNDKTEILQQNDRTEILPQNDKTEILPQSEKTVLLFEKDGETVQKVNQSVSRTEKPLHEPEIEGIPIDKRSDIYSLGATLYHLYTGKRVDLDEGRVLQSSTGEGFTYVLNKALQTNPDKRFQDAGEMLKVIKSIHKVDKRYKKILLLQNLVRIAVVVLVVIGVLMIYQGRKQIEEEKLADYTALIQDMEIARQNLQEVELNSLFDSATAMFPNHMEAYYQKVLYFYEEKSYEECISFANSVLEREEWDTSELIDEIYYILGNSYFKTEDYEAASFSFEMAVQYYGQNGVYYVDHAISLARLNRIEDAKTALAKAQQWNVTGDNISLVNGEINLALKNFDLAEQDFKECISITTDDYVLFRAYMMLSETYFAKPQDIHVLQTNIEVLKEAKQKLEMEYRISIMQQLVQAYMDAAALTGEQFYDTEAIAVLCEINNMGWGTFTTWNNLAVLYQKIGDYDNAYASIESMSEKSAENYAVYKRYAFLELAIQDERDEIERDYQKFAEYYEKAMELYKDAMAENQSDSEMQLLESAYIQLQDGNWLL